MFFKDHTTPAEQRAGFVNREDLVARLAAGAHPFALKFGFAEVAIVYSSVLYELKVQRPEDGSSDCILFWEVSATAKRIVSETCRYEFNNAQVPLHWLMLFEMLSDCFDINLTHLHKKAVDLDAFWVSKDFRDNGKMQIPKKKIGKKYRFRKLYP